ncbi:LysR family transcriptional regulator [Lelliottia nimipressuralis]|uniref:LysR family transcriptional regulator n=1 Tax=Lelliottia nimipressuralis TaxID=69220 RepID=UPI0022ABD65C|nr:LysR family transcriptional regulator [Lelliottia nimipressuralis]
MFFSKQFHQFIAAVEEGNFLKASEKISITPSAMSRGIGELENKMGARLLERTRQGIRLTQKGEKLYRELLPHYLKIKQIANELKRLKNQKEIIIQTDGLYFPRIKEAIFKTLEDKTDIKISLLPGKQDKPENAILKGVVDIYISTCDAGNTNISTICMKPNIMGMVCHRDILRDYKDIKNILAHNAIIQTHTGFNHQLYQQLLESLASEGHKTNTLPLNDVTDVCYLVNQGCGVSFMSASMIGNYTFTDNITFIEKPLNSPVFFQRKIHFKTERFNELMNVLSLLSDL